MRKRLGAAALAVMGSMAGSAMAQQGATALVNAGERLDDLAYGLFEVCLPAQRAGLSLGDFEATNRNALNLARKRTANSTRIATWSVQGSREVAVLENESGCTVSTSFWQEDADQLIPDLRGRLTGAAAQYQVVQGNPDDIGDTGLVVAFCAAGENGERDSWYLYETLGKPEQLSGQRRTARQYFVSIVAPTEPFCAPEAQQE